MPLYSPYGLAVSIPAMMIPHLLIVGVLEGITLGAYSYIKKDSPEIIYKGNAKYNELINYLKSLEKVVLAFS